ncbi:hypothetical protein [Streptococcus gordonii]|uniref:hypothetical protein n=1 Tax=Streptococcus gordonii TaxID=1302 RepID=UPI001EDED34B|nr:hypothetical protein [Streptococcus gordonii]MCG4823779.1 hypothetical protein [Streptococcus gordonii]MCG4847886.1 hypothetical protein [Streptococcus gordonii]MDE8687825.1 hypothetical protein [Streptococcus gordonii]
MDLITFVDKLTPVLVVVIPSYFSYKSNKSSKETDKRIEALSEDFGELKESVASIKEIGDRNNSDLNLIQKGLQRLQRFRLQENLKKALRRGYTTQHELEELSRLYESYVELGGNGAVKILFEKFSKLNTKEEK